MGEEVEPEILSYREFKKRETLLAWQRRRRAVEAQLGARGESARRHDEFMKLAPGSRTGLPTSG